MAAAEIPTTGNATRHMVGLKTARAHLYSPLHNEEVTTGSNCSQKAAALQEWILLYW